MSPLNVTMLKQSQDVTKMEPFRQDGKTLMETHGRLHFGNRNKETKQRDFYQALVFTKGLIHKSCDMAHIRYATYIHWLKSDKRFQEKLEETHQMVNEAVEASLIRKMDMASPNAEMFYLKSRDPRYKAVAVLEGNEDKPIVITHDEKTLEKIGKKIMESLKNE